LSSRAYFLPFPSQSGLSIETIRSPRNLVKLYKIEERQQDWTMNLRRGCINEQAGYL
jgi:hypothetical protein